MLPIFFVTFFRVVVFVFVIISLLSTSYDVSTTIYSNGNIFFIKSSVINHNQSFARSFTTHLFIETCKFFLFSERHRRHNVLVSFSIWSNTSRLLKLSHNTESLTCLNGLRAISILWIVLGHRYLTTILFPLINTNEILNVNIHLWTCINLRWSKF